MLQVYNSNNIACWNWEKYILLNIFPRYKRERFQNKSVICSHDVMDLFQRQVADFFLVYFHDFIADSEKTRKETGWK